MDDLVARLPEGQRFDIVRRVAPPESAALSVLVVAVQIEQLSRRDGDPDQQPVDLFLVNLVARFPEELDGIDRLVCNQQAKESVDVGAKRKQVDVRPVDGRDAGWVHDFPVKTSG